MSNSTIAIHCSPFPLFAGTGRYGCSDSLQHGCETETFGVHYKELFCFSFSWHTGYRMPQCTKQPLLTWDGPNTVKARKEVAMGSSTPVKKRDVQKSRKILHMLQ